VAAFEEERGTRPGLVTVVPADETRLGDRIIGLAKSRVFEAMPRPSQTMKTGANAILGML
jgi:hypothetical protein